jgi:hypothetical protein
MLCHMTVSPYSGILITHTGKVSTLVLCNLSHVFAVALIQQRAPGRACLQSGRHPLGPQQGTAAVVCWFGRRPDLQVCSSHQVTLAA